MGKLYAKMGKRNIERRKLNYPTALYLIRLNADGSLDSTFYNTISIGNA